MLGIIRYRESLNPTVLNVVASPSVLKLVVMYVSLTVQDTGTVQDIGTAARACRTSGRAVRTPPLGSVFFW